MNLPMWGQWLGNARGSNRAGLILNIDKDKPSEGFIHFRDSDLKLSSIAAKVKFASDGSNLVGQLSDIYPSIRIEFPLCLILQKVQPIGIEDSQLEYSINL